MGIRWQYIRAAAASLRDAYAAEAGLALAPLQLPLEDVAQRVHLLTVCDDPDLDPRINGELNPQIGSIRLRPGMPETRRRFVIAHELGHYVLEGGSLILYEDDDTTLDERAGGDVELEAGVGRAYNTRERREQEANLFALELLIPAHALWQAVQQPEWYVGDLARRFGVSTEALKTQLINVCCLEPVRATETHHVAHAPFAPDPYQQAAVSAALPTLVVAGPGTGKTRTIVAKYVDLVSTGVDPAHILALTFSNKAAEEMRERIIVALRTTHPHLAGRVEISTFHAWGLNFLKHYGRHVGLPLDVRLRSTGDLYVLLRRRLADLPLEAYKDLRDPGMYLGQIIGAISRAKDELCGPETYRQLAEAEALRLVAAAERQQAGKTTKTAQQARDRATRDAARLRELAAIYARYAEILREEQVLDYGDLIVQSVQALKIPAVAVAVQAHHHYILVDEFQDINYASGELVRLLDGGRGRVWAVGDPWQSIYHFRGASPANLQDFTTVYPHAEVRDLQLNYRSAQPILDSSHALMIPDPLFSVRRSLQAWRSLHSHAPAVVERVMDDAEQEAAVIAHDILRLVRPARRLPRCTRLLHRPHARTQRPSPLTFRVRRAFGDIAVLCRTHTQAARIAAVLQAHSIPVDQAGELFDVPEVKDVLSIAAIVRTSSSAGMLRALTIPEHALSRSDMATLVRLAHQTRQALPRAARDPAIIDQLSVDGQQHLWSLHALTDSLATLDDAWQVLVHYLFEHSSAMRHTIAAATDAFSARRSLAALGQLLVLARNFVRQAPPGERGSPEFISYIRTLIEAGERMAAVVPAEQANVVRVMTVHAAKGLEFPVVYVPGVQDGIYPHRRPGSSIPALPAMIHGAPVSHAQEERYLLYVAMTRARDQLILSRAAMRGDKPVKRTPLLPEGPDGAQAPWPVLPCSTHTRCPEARQELRLSDSPVTRTPIPATSIETYERCPRQYLYQYGYQLYDDLSPYLRMHQTIRDLVQELTQRVRDGTLPPDEAALRAAAWQVFVGHEMEDVLYRDDYFTEALRHVAHVWRELQSGAYEPDAVDRRYVVRRPDGELAVRVDRIEQQPDGPRWVRTRSGREREQDHLSTPIMLYTLAAQQEHGAAFSIALHYTATGAVRPATPKPQVLADHISTIDTLLEGIKRGRWDPSVGPQCATCPFNLICPV